MESNEGQPELPQPPLRPDRVVLHISYPKTGSTLVPSLVDRLRDASAEYTTEVFTFGKSKNNVRLMQQSVGTLHLLKTHHTAADFFLRNRAELQSDVPALRAFMAGGLTGLAASDRGLIYSMRNPFATLASAIQYAKQIYAREGEATKWQQDGRATRYFVHLLGLKAVPDPAQYQNFRFLELPPAWLEDICWRYVDTRGSIPFLETEDTPSYFEHVNHHTAQLAQPGCRCELTYERLMAGDRQALQDFGAVVGVQASHLQRALDAEAADRAERTGRYIIPFFDNFQVATPAVIRALPSWRQIRDRALALCPPLAQTLPAAD